MKSLVGFFLVLAGLFFFTGGVAAVHLVGDLQLTGEPGVRVWVNDELKGEITADHLYLEDLAAGSYAIRAENSAGRIILEDFQIFSGRLTELVLDFSAARPLQVEDFVFRKKITTHDDKSGDLVLRSIPPKARIFLDGKEIGSSDKLIHNVPAVKHEVRFVLQEKELVHSFTMHSGEKLFLKAHFDWNKIISQNSQNKIDAGPEQIVLKTLKARRPALFPHRFHQEKQECGKCHHLKDEQGGQLPYYEGMNIQHCTSCHNPDTMPNKMLSSFKLAGHALCKGCHKLLQENGETGPVAKCTGCHLQ